MSTELSNGVIIPEEYSDDWYDEMSINLRKLNDVITAASDNATDIQRLDTDKANQSDLTALTSRVSQNETDIIALQTAVSGALKREIVQTLPTEDISTTTIYMIRNSQSSGTNIYDEYMYINSQWELIGTSATDFSNYYTKTESDNLLSAKANQTDLTSLSGRVTQNETDITALQTAVSGALKREIVQSLPTQDISTTTIYMIRNTTTSGDNIYDEYMYINNLWELIGTSATDFSNYYTKTEIDTLLSDKATDSDVVHKSGNETKSGELTLSSTLKSSDIVPLTNLNFNLGSPDYKYNNVYAYMYNSIGRNLGNEANSNHRTNITLYANRDTQNQSCAYITRFRQNRAQGALQTGDLQMIGFDVLENEVRTNNVFSIQCSGWVDNVPTKVKFISTSSYSTFGSSAKPSKINDLNPSSLGMPDLSNGIDISSYLSVGASTNDSYTAPANGYIGVIFASSSPCGCYVYNYTDGVFMRSNSITDSTYTNVCGCFIPILKNQTLNISTRATESIVSAKFYPCLGNI